MSRTSKQARFLLYYQRSVAVKGCEGATTRYGGERVMSIQTKAMLYEALGAAMVLLGGGTFVFYILRTLVN